MRLRKELIIPLSILAGIALGTTSATGYADSTPTNQETNANIQAEQSMEQNPTDVVNSEQKDELVDNQATNEEEQQAPQDDLTVSTAKAAHPGWNQDQYGWSYYRNNGTYLRNQWQWINGNWYLFTNDGYMAANGIYYAPNNTDMYCFNGDGHYLTNTWFRYSSWRYAKSDGILASDWQKINGRWYYFDPDSFLAHPAVTGWQNLNGRWYYFDNDNAWADTGWQKINSHWYYFDPTNAWAVTNWQRINGRWYYFDSNNAWALENWQKINGRWYYFDSNNAWADSGWQLIDGKWYYFDPTNAWADTGWQKINNHWYYFDPENCWALLGIQKINGCWYYLDPVDAWMYTGTQTINGKQFTFATDGKYTGQSDLSKERRYNPETKEMETPVNGYLIYWTERGGYADDPHSSDQVQKQILVTPYPKIKLTPVYIDKAKKVYNYTYNIPEWVDTDYSDYNTKVETDGHGHITGESAKVAAIFAAQIINYMRKQIGSIPVKVSQESIAANYDAAKLNDPGL
ncbi:hypothetical protein [Limosilactobacillus kribbianus]|uniref:hypothetical protein n=1 Tax=Limosilactobacillus kribbianus TaxID=2982695 RepID=UPI002264FC34|nr:hypothetical protein [Limosilactobacillus kribbianus]